VSARGPVAALLRRTSPLHARWRCAGRARPRHHPAQPRGGRGAGLARAGRSRAATISAPAAPTRRSWPCRGRLPRRRGDPLRDARALLPHRPHRPLHGAIIASAVRPGGGGLPGRKPAGHRRGVSPLRSAGTARGRGLPGGRVPRPPTAPSSADPRGRPWSPSRRRPPSTASSPSAAAGPAAQISWITGRAARLAAHELRARHDAVLVGAATVRADDPRLTVACPVAAPARGRAARGAGRPLSAPPRARLFAARAPGPAPLVLGPLPIACPGRERARPAPPQARARAAPAPRSRCCRRSDRPHPPARALRFLARRRVQSLLVEGGSRVHGALHRRAPGDEVACSSPPGSRARAAPRRGGRPALLATDFAWGPSGCGCSTVIYSCPPNGRPRQTRAPSRK
jgi:riboflavin biosynthesis pyrimidine reductase